MKYNTPKYREPAASTATFLRHLKSTCSNCKYFKKEKIAIIKITKLTKNEVHVWIAKPYRNKIPQTFKVLQDIFSTNNMTCTSRKSLKCVIDINPINIPKGISIL